MSVDRIVVECRVFLEVAAVCDAIDCSDLVHWLDTKVFELCESRHHHHAVTTVFESSPHFTLVLVSKHKDI